MFRKEALTQKNMIPAVNLTVQNIGSGLYKSVKIIKYYLGGNLKWKKH